MGNLFPVLCWLEPLLQVVSSAVGAGEQILGMNFKMPALTCVLPDHSWAMKANLYSKVGFAEGGNNPLLPGAWRKG